MTAPVQLVFYGEVLEGFAAAAVKRTFGELFKLDAARLASMFTGGRVVINASVAADEAPLHVARFAKIGVRLVIEPLEAVPGAQAEVAAVPAPAPISAPAPLSTATAEPAPAPAPAAAASAAPAAALPMAAEEEIICPNCGERQSKRLLCRACATDMPMGIAAKLEAEQEARAAALAERQARRGGSRVAARAPGASNGRATMWGVGLSGRMGRLAYATAGTVLLSAMLLVTLALFKWPGKGGFAVFALGMLLILAMAMRWSALRCHDFNRSGWWSLLLMVPYVGAIFGLVLSFMPGSRDENDHGEPPNDGSWPMFLGSLVPLAVTAALSGSALLAAWAGRGEMQAEGLHDSAPADDTALSLLRPEARAAYLNEYVVAPGHKSFAISPSGAWGWKSGAASIDAAVDAALATCTANRKPYTPECVPVNVDGAWVPIQPP